LKTQLQHIILSISFKEAPQKGLFYSYPLSVSISMKKPVLSVSFATIQENKTKNRCRYDLSLKPRF